MVIYIHYNQTDWSSAVCTIITVLRLLLSTTDHKINPLREFISFHRTSNTMYTFLLLSILLTTYNILFTHSPDLFLNLYIFYKILKHMSSFLSMWQCNATHMPNTEEPD